MNTDHPRLIDWESLAFDLHYQREQEMSARIRELETEIDQLKKRGTTCRHGRRTRDGQRSSGRTNAAEPADAK